MKLQSAYNALYVQMRRYVWDFETVEALADLEVSVYQAFPDVEKLSNKFQKLKRIVSYFDVYTEDDILSQSFDKFETLLDEDTEIYASLISYKGVTVV